MIRIACHITCFMALCAPALALELPLPPNAQAVYQSQQDGAAYDIALSVWTPDGAGETLPVSGILNQKVWQIGPYSGTVLQLVAPIEAALAEAGYQTRLRCLAEDCGGFDFRFARDLPNEPVLHVDLANYIYLSAERAGESGPEYLDLIASRGGTGAYLYVAQIGPDTAEDETVVVSTRSPDVRDIPLSVAEQLLSDGRASLDALVFDTGLSSLSGENYSDLIEVARLLEEDSRLRLVLVGHTDAQGALDRNIALSRSRADAVRRHLIDRLGVSPAQVSAEGVGYLAPRAANETEAGRQANRRVEAILLSAE